MMTRLKTTNLEVLQAIASYGGFDVGTLTINTHTGGGLYTPIYYALKDLTKFGYVHEICTGLFHDGTPRRGWSLTPSGIAALELEARRGPRSANGKLLSKGEAPPPLSNRWRNAALLTRDQDIRFRRGRATARVILAVVYCVAGVLHCSMPAPFVSITPDWVPFPQQVILLTGLCEIAGAIALMTAKLRPAAGIALALYAVCVYPANVKHAFDHVAVGSLHLGWWYHAPRLAFQPVLVWWALFAGDVVTWPFRRVGANDPRSA